MGAPAIPAEALDGLRSGMEASLERAEDLLDGLDMKAAVAHLEARLIRRAEAVADGNRQRMAELLGISLRALYYKMARLE